MDGRSATGGVFKRTQLQREFWSKLGRSYHGQIHDGILPDPACGSSGQVEIVPPSNVPIWLVCLSATLPDEPDSARNMKVVLRLLIDTRGRVVDVRIDSADGSPEFISNCIITAYETEYIAIEVGVWVRRIYRYTVAEKMVCR